LQFWNIVAVLVHEDRLNSGTEVNEKQLLNILVAVVHADRLNSGTEVKE
jgi:hypothetical protein